MNRAVYAGTFDPPHNGHFHVIRQAARAFDAVYVVIAINPNKRPSGLFSPEVRKELIEAQVAQERLTNVFVHITEGLVGTFAVNMGAKTFIRGLRSEGDLRYELDLAYLNSKYFPELQTFFVGSRPELTAISSTNVKECAKLGMRIGWMVPAEIENAIHARLRAINAAR